MSRPPTSSLRILLVGAVLLALLLLSWGLARIGLGSWSTPVALGIAAVKAGLVVWFFMELSEAAASLRVAGAVVAVLFVIFLALTSADPATRAQAPLVPASTSGDPTPPGAPLEADPRGLPP
jgi:cytochrome c oxidase subunit 4